MISSNFDDKNTCEVISGADANCLSLSIDIHFLKKIIDRFKTRQEKIIRCEGDRMFKKGNAIDLSLEQDNRCESSILQLSLTSKAR